MEFVMKFLKNDQNCCDFDGFEQKKNVTFSLCRLELCQPTLKPWWCYYTWIRKKTIFANLIFSSGKYFLNQIWCKNHVFGAKFDRKCQFWSNQPPIWNHYLMSKRACWQRAGTSTSYMSRYDGTYLIQNCKIKILLRKIRILSRKSWCEGNFGRWIQVWWSRNEIRQESKKPIFDLAIITQKFCSPNFLINLATLQYP